MTFESGVVPEAWRSAVAVPLHKGKGERTECRNYEPEEDLKTMMGRFAEVCRRRGLKTNAGKGRVMVLNREERLKCKICTDGICSAHVSEFKYFGADGAECSRKVGRRGWTVRFA